MPADPSTDLTTIDVKAPDGRSVRVHDTGATRGPAHGGGDLLTVVWHHGTGNTGEPPRPLFAAARRLGVRMVGVDRPGYGGSTPLPGRSIADVATDVTVALDRLGVETCAVIGHSGGGPHALACAALLPDRVVAAVAMAGPAPLGPMRAEGRDWYAGFAPYGVASMRAAEHGQAARVAYEESGADDDFGFDGSDIAALEGDWAWLLEVVRSGQANGAEPMIDDDLATVTPWGFDVESISVPTLVVHGADDHVVPAAHGLWVAAHTPGAELWLEPQASHVSVLRRAEDALEWLRDNAVR